MGKKVKAKWIQGAVDPKKKGLFKRQLGVYADERIPKTLLQKIVKAPLNKRIENPTKTGYHSILVTRLMKQRANFVLNAAYGGKGK